MYNKSAVEECEHDLSGPRLKSSYVYVRTRGCMFMYVHV